MNTILGVRSPSSGGTKRRHCHSPPLMARSSVFSYSLTRPTSWILPFFSSFPGGSESLLTGSYLSRMSGRRDRMRRPHTRSSETTDELSKEYTDTMQRRMGAPSLIYNHEDGMNFHRIDDDIIVGSCLQTAEDLDKIADEERVTTVLCLQEDSDMAYFDLDVTPIRQRAKQRSDVAHLRHAIRDFDPFSLRRRLPGAVSLLIRRTERCQKNVSYVHCTAGLGRAPAVALAYMWWYKGMPLSDAYEVLTSIRPCKPRVDAIREATVDLLYSGIGPVPTTIRLLRRGTAQSVAVAGLDVGWGQSIPLRPDPKTKKLSVTRWLPSGVYQYKFIYDEDVWGASVDHMTCIDGDNLNNKLVVPDADLGPDVAVSRARLRSPDGDLTPTEREKLVEILRGMTDVVGEDSSAPCDLH